MKIKRRNNKVETEKTLKWSRVGPKY